eukprot:365718-Chlamydomonas_euryale.AAC.10
MQPVALEALAADSCARHAPHASLVHATLFKLEAAVAVAAEDNCVVWLHNAAARHGAAAGTGAGACRRIAGPQQRLPAPSSGGRLQDDGDVGVTFRLKHDDSAAVRTVLSEHVLLACTHVHMHAHSRSSLLAATKLCAPIERTWQCSSHSQQPHPGLPQAC